MTVTAVKEPTMAKEPTISEYWKQQTMRRRARARKDGKCVICMCREARDGRKTCEQCSSAATQATRLRRQGEKGLKPQTPGKRKHTSIVGKKKAGATK